MKIHLHEEQFDGVVHAACGRTNSTDPQRVIPEDSFSELSRVTRCAYCSKINWPHGEPL